MDHLQHLFESNARWAEAIKEQDPHFFQNLENQQSPQHLWIGCADSRVPANEIVGMMPGELFVHRNIGNCVVHSDLNCLSVLYYAVCVLKVKHIIVCGHYGCGGVQAALENEQYGLPDHWIRNIRDVYFRKHEEIDAIEDENLKLRRFCELNVIQQMANVSYIPAIQNAWRDGQELTIHAWIYGVGDGRLRRLATPINDASELPKAYQLV